MIYKNAFRFDCPDWTERLETGTLIKLGFNPMSVVTKPLGMAVRGAGKLIGGAANFAGWALAKHPGKTLAIGLPLGFTAWQAPGLYNQYQNNVNPQNPYMDSPE